MKNIPVVLLNGGRGYYSEEFKETVPKGSVTVLGKPLLLHIIEHYLENKFNDFVICEGIKATFSKERVLSFIDDLTENANGQYTGKVNGIDLKLRFVDTGDSAPTWERIKKAKGFINTDYFALSYTDTYSNIDLIESERQFLASNSLISLTAANFPVRFRVLGMVAGKENVQGFSSSPVIQNDFINGGFYFVKKSIFSLYESKENVAFEQEILNDAVNKHQIYAYKLEGDWQHFDSPVDLEKIKNILKKENK